MERYAWKATVKEGMLEEYVRRHNEIWPELTEVLRQAGIRTQLYTEQKKFKQKMSYADKLGVPYVVFLGEDEVRQGAVSVKDMISGEQNTLPLDQAVVHMKNDLAVRAALLPIREPDRD